MKTKFKLLALSASLLACGIGVSGQAQATPNAYAFAANNIKDGFIGAYVDNVLQTANGPYLTFGIPQSESSTSATLYGSGVANQAVSPPPAPNGPVSTVGVPVRPEELLLAAGEAIAAPHGGIAAIGGTYYKPFGTLGSNYSWGDANIVSEQSLTGAFIVARNAAESNLASIGSANADGTNKSSTSLSIPIVVGGDCGSGKVCQVDFSFMADPYILAMLTADAKSPHVARGTLAMHITLTKDDQSYIFSWSPNGVVGPAGGCAVGGATIGGCEYADAENLNLTMEVLNPGQTKVHSAPYANNVYGAYGARTNALGTGTYTLNLFMNEKTDVQLPEPATIGLLGLGLLGLGFARRRKQA